MNIKFLSLTLLTLCCISHLDSKADPTTRFQMESRPLSARKKDLRDNRWPRVWDVLKAMLALKST